MKVFFPKLVIAIFILGLIIGGGWNEIRKFGIELFPVRYVRVGGAFQNLKKEQLREVLLPVVTTSFFSADIKDIQLAAVSLAWIDSAEVKRIWPGTLDIKINEQNPVARWGNKGLINERGELFKPIRKPRFEELPQISGPVGQEKRLFEVMKKLNQKLLDHDFFVAELGVSERRSWKLKLANGMTMELGRKTPLEKFQRFLKVLPVLGKSKIEMIEKVDMRYPNGFTVTWKPEVEIEWEKHNRLPENKQG